MKRFVRPSGHDCSTSTGIHDALTFGTGRLDVHGFWEHGCHECARAHEQQFPEDGPCWPHSEKRMEEWKLNDKANNKDQVHEPAR